MLGAAAALSGEAIPLLGRIVAVAGAYDAMTTDRPYRAGLPPDAAQIQLLRGRGAQFDPPVVDALVEALRRGIVRFEEPSDRGGHTDEGGSPASGR